MFLTIFFTIQAVYNSVIQRYGNLSGPGEYAAECLLKCTRSSDITCMPKPIMSHQRNRYTVHYDEEHGFHFLRQIRVSMEDFAALHSPNSPQQATCQMLSSTASSSSSAASHGGGGAPHAKGKDAKNAVQQTSKGIARPGKGRGF